MATQNSVWLCAGIASQTPASTMVDHFQAATALPFQAPSALLARNNALFPPILHSVAEDAGSNIRNSHPSTSQTPSSQPQLRQEHNTTTWNNMYSQTRVNLSSHDDKPSVPQATFQDVASLTSPFVGSSGLGLHGQQHVASAHNQPHRSVSRSDVSARFSDLNQQGAGQIQKPADSVSASGPSQALLTELENINEIPQSWSKAPVPTDLDTASSLGLFIPEKSQPVVPSVLLSASVDAVTQPDPAITDVSTSAPLVTSSSSDVPGFSPLMLISQSMQGSTPRFEANATCVATHGSGPDLTPFASPQAAPNLLVEGSIRMQQDVVDHERSLMDTHTHRLGMLLGLQHSLPSTHQHSPREGTRLDHFHTQARNLESPSQLPALMTAQQPTTRRYETFHQEKHAQQHLALPQGTSSSAVFVMNREDVIVWSSDTALTCLSTLHGSDFGHQVNLQFAQGSGVQPIKFSDLLADAQVMGWWQQACREVLLTVRQKDGIWQQHSGRGRDACAPRPAKKELILRWRSQSGEDSLVQVDVVAAQKHEDLDGCYLMARVEPTFIPTIATISSQPMLATISPRSRSFPSAAFLSHTAKSTVLNKAEMRLLVSRYGLILRTACSMQPTGLASPSTLPECDLEARATFAILGDGAGMPAFGQSLVEIPKLTPLLHVVAQAAVVGLAQTVKLSAGGRQITAVVQPVLRPPTAGAMDTRRTSPPAAKIWITLSAVATIMRRPKSSSSLATSGFTNNFPAFIGLPSESQVGVSSPMLLDRRHSVQSLRQEAGLAGPGWPPLSPSQSERRASTASLYVHAALNQASSSRKQHTSDNSSDSKPEQQSQLQRRNVQPKQPIQVDDNFSLLMSKLEEENRILREQVEARQRKWTSQSPLQAPTPMQLNNAPAPPLDPLLGSNLSGSCTTRLLHLS